jgi:hypothetical protein
VVSKALINQLFNLGLGELLVLHARKSGPLLGQVVQEKGRLTLKDHSMLQGVETAQVGPCYDIGICGAVCFQEGHQWESLTFVGPEHCLLDMDLTATHVGLMRAARNAFNERLIDFTGSVYRGYQLMMDNHILPVVLMKEIPLEGGGTGLAVSNLRIAGISFEVLGAVHSELRDLMERKLSLDVQDVVLNESDFDSLFAQFIESSN